MKNNKLQLVDSNGAGKTSSYPFNHLRTAFMQITQVLIQSDAIPATEVENSKADTARLSIKNQSSSSFNSKITVNIDSSPSKYKW